jgi:hypothetical protein
MPECSVCRGYYEEEQSKCNRCGSDNSAWKEWRREEKELGTVRSVIRFLEPLLGLPLIIASCALAFGLLGTVWLWGGIRPPVLVLIIAFTCVLCLSAPFYVYAERFALRERELLRRVQRGWKHKGIGISEQALLVPAVSAALAMLVALLLLQSDMVWGAMEWLVLEPTEPAVDEQTAEQAEPGLKEKVERAIPLMCLSGYVFAMASSAYASSLMLGQEYAQRLNESLPYPIFLQDEKLAQIVRREAEIELGRDPRGTEDLMNVMGYIKFEGQPSSKLLKLTPLASEVEESSPPQAELWSLLETWLWDEMKRTDDGGIEMKVARQEMYQLPTPTEKSELRPSSRVSYTVRADAWGRIIEIKQGAAE